MIFGNSTISQYKKSNIIVWMLMAFQAGTLNIGGFMACHRFVSHITGFATFFGYELSQNDLSHAIGMLIVPLFFIMGVMLSAFLIDTQIRLEKKPRYYLSFGLIFSLVFIVFCLGISKQFGLFGEPLADNRDYVLLFFLCFICGIQNGTITTVSKSVIRTTHLTGITTDLGIGIVRLFNSKSVSDGIENEKKANLMRFGIILFFLMGSVIGGNVFKHYEYWGFALPLFTSGVLFFGMIYFQFLHTNRQNN